jgi:hypothetical protein
MCLACRPQPKSCRWPASSQVYETAASRLLAQSVWNRNKVTVDTGRLSRELQRQFPELAGVSVTIPLLAHRPLVYIEPSRPTLMLATAHGSFVVDDRGKALARANDSTGFQGLNLPVLTDQSGLKFELNHQALPAPHVSFIQTVAAQLAAKQITIASMTLPAAASQLDVQPVGQPYYIKFNLESNDPRGQAGTFLAAIAGLKRQNITPAKYVDVRVAGRAYYQ